MRSRLRGNRGGTSGAVRALLVMTLLAVVACSPEAGDPAHVPPPRVAADAPAADAPATTVLLAVLPFASTDTSATTRDVADGMARHLLATLAQLQGVDAISTESSFQFRNSSELNSVLSERLGATHVLRGSFELQGGLPIVQMELLRGSDAATLWSAPLNGRDGGVFAVEDAIVAGVARALHVPVPNPATREDRPPSGSQVAYDTVLQGDAQMALGDAAALQRAIDAYQRAVAVDPTYAFARARLAQARVARFMQDPVAAHSEAENAGRDADAALRLAPSSAEAHRAKAAWLAGVAKDPAGAMAELKHALVQRPGTAELLQALAIQQVSFGQLEAAADSLREALKHNPLSAPTLYSLGSVYLGLADYPQAEHVLRQALALEPKLPLVHAFLALAVFQQNRTAEAVTIAEREPHPLWRNYALAMACWANGERARSDAALQTLIRDYAQTAPTQIAGVYAQRDDAEQLFHWLDVAREVGDPGIVEIRYMPYISRYTSDPRFIKLVDELGLQQPRPRAAH